MWGSNVHPYIRKGERLLPKRPAIVTIIFRVQTWTIISYCEEVQVQEKIAK